MTNHAIYSDQNVSFIALIWVIHFLIERGLLLFLLPFLNPIFYYFYVTFFLKFNSIQFHSKKISINNNNKTDLWLKIISKSHCDILSKIPYMLQHILDLESAIFQYIYMGRRLIKIIKNNSLPYSDWKCFISFRLLLILKSQVFSWKLS